MANNINKVVYGNTVLVDMTDATLASTDGDQILNGQTAYGKDGNKITGTCTYNADTTDATASASDILSGVTAYGASGKITGTMPNNGGTGGTITDVDEPYTIPAGYSDGSATVNVSAEDIAKLKDHSNIKNGVTILGETGTYEGEAQPTQSKTATPYTTQQTILPDTDYLLNAVTVEAIYYNETANSFGTTVTIGKVAPSA